MVGKDTTQDVEFDEFDSMIDDNEDDNTTDDFDDSDMQSDEVGQSDNHEAFAKINKELREQKNLIKKIEKATGKSIDDLLNAKENDSKSVEDYQRQIDDLKNEFETAKSEKEKQEQQRAIVNDFNGIVNSIKSQNNLDEHTTKLIRDDKGFRKEFFRISNIPNLSDTDKEILIQSALDNIKIDEEHTQQKPVDDSIGVDEAWLNFTQTEKYRRNNYKEQKKEFYENWNKTH